MGRLYTLLLLGLFLTCGLVSCSDEENTIEGPDPFLPVTGLKIPKQELIDTLVTLQGKGFEADCRLQLQLNGTDNVFDVEIVEVEGDSLTFRTHGLDAGFYIVLLLQNDTIYRIGGINLLPSGLKSRDIDAIGVVGEENSKVYPVSLTRKMKGNMLFALPTGYIFYGGLMHKGIWYYLAYWHDEGENDNWNWKNLFLLGAYDYENNTQTAILQKQEGVMAIGIINDKLNMFCYDDQKCYLKEWDGTAWREVISFANTSVTKMCLIHDGIFVYDQARRTLVMSGWDMRGSSPRKYVWTISLDQPEIVETGGTTSIVFHLLDCNGTVYAFGEEVIDEDTGNINTYIFKLTDPTNWQYAALARECKLEKTSFDGPVYHPTRKVVYGVDEGMVMSYDLKAKKLVGGKWVGSGLINVFLLDNK